MLSMKTRYALRALIRLAQDYGQGPMLTADLAKKEGIPKKFLELILLELKNSGVVQSKRGKNGGYSLAHPPDEIKLGGVVRITGGPLAPVPCVSHMAYQHCDCADEAKCGVRLVMKQVRDAMAQILDKTSLDDIRKTLASEIGGQEKEMFYI